MKSGEIRQRFLDYFAGQGHAVVASASLVPDDPTLLFTNAGMVQFKDAFLGMERRSYRRATSAQKCMRVSGKHNDLENVGPSPRHHTFFEMLGNFSFGDYFKRDAIRFGWEFLTETMGIEPDRLVFTVFRDDDEAFRVWTEEIGVAPARVLRMGEKTNLWMMADVGPCGPTTEIHFDFGPGRCTCGSADCSVALDNDCGRWLELWNLVFMQYDQLADGTRRQLPQTGVDTGMGLERLVAVMQGVYSNYETDLFTPILDRVQALVGHAAAERERHLTGYRVLADHGRAMAFLIADGVLPGNDGRNYVLRLILRRAMRFGKLLGFDRPFLPDLVAAVIQTMGEPYPDLVRRADWIREVVAEEEARFERTLESGLAILDDMIAAVKGTGGGALPGRDVFRLYDTYGFPPDLTRVVAEERGFGIDRAGFEAAMAEQKRRARSGGVFGVAERADYYRRLALPEVRFLGYATTEAEGEVLALTVDGATVPGAETGAVVEVVLDRTPFYAEAGGQVADRGWLESAGGAVRVDDTQSPIPGVIVHHGVVERGSVRAGDRVTARVDAARRYDIMRNHTATHLLHRALQEVLGDHAQQRGSLVSPERLRFDFSHLRAMTRAELDRVEARVNEMVRADAEVSWQVMPLDEARGTGAMMLFGEKYGDAVRVVSVAGLTRELCGGTHLDRTGQIGLFLIRSETSVGAGLRRIEALTGRGAEAYVRARLRELDALAEQLGAPGAEDLPERLTELQTRQRQLERELEAQRATAARDQAAAVTGQAVMVEGVQVVAARVAAADASNLREQIDAVRQAAGPAVIVLGAVIDDRPRLVAAVDESLLARGCHAGQLVKALATGLGGGGGGRPQLAEAGGQDSAALDRVLALVPDQVRQMMNKAQGA